MVGSRIAGAGGLVGLAGILLTQGAASVTSHAAGTTPYGMAQASSIAVSLSPQAIAPALSAVTSALQSLPDACGAISALSNAATSTTSVALDSATATGTLTGTADDVASGGATSSAVAISLAGIDQVLSGVQKALSGDLSCVTAGLPVSSLPAQLQQGLASLQQQLPAATAPLSAVLGQIGADVEINRTLKVALDQQPQSSQVLTVGNPLGPSLQLAPFDAVAVSRAGAEKWNVSTGPQLEAHNTTTRLDLGQSLGITSASAAATQLPDLISTATAELGSVQTALTALSQNSAASSVCANPTVAALPGCSLIQNATGSQATQTLEASLQATQSSLQALVARLTALKALLAGLPSLDLNSIVHADGATSSTLTQPQNGGVHSIATTSFAHLQLLSLVSASVPQLGASAGTPLIELTGVSSSAEAFVNGVDASPPTGTASLGQLSVLGKPVVDVGSLLPGTNITQTVATPAGDLTVVINRGAPQTINNTVQRKTEGAAALQVQLINGDAQGNNQVAGLGARSGGPVANITVAAVQVDDSMTPPTADLVNAAPPSTGLPGPFGFVGAGLLGLTGLALRLASRQRRTPNA